MIAPLPQYDLPPPAAPRHELLYGFTIGEWALYGKKESEIAGRVCRENGNLKRQVNPPVEPMEPLTASQGKFVGISLHSPPSKDGPDMIFDNDPRCTAAAAICEEEGLEPRAESNAWAD